MMIVNPVIVEPLAAEWEAAKVEIVALMAKAVLPNELAASASEKAVATKARNQAQERLDRHLMRLADFRVLDPACGSGNFLYLALKALKDLEHLAQVEAEALGLPRRFPQIGPEVVRGIELNSYAAELARVSVWIGEIQWMLRNGFSAAENPVLKPLDTIEYRDALMNPDGTRAAWPEADVIIGNPPFLGGKRLISALGDDYVTGLRAAYSGTVEPFADLVCYWFERARQQIATGATARAGLVSTNSIRGGASRETLKRILASSRIFNAWADEPWVVGGAAVRVSLVCFGDAMGEMTMLDGSPVPTIHPDLTSGHFDISSARPLPENRGACFEGGQKYGAFDVPGAVARDWLALPTNPNGRKNGDVLRPYLNAKDVVRRSDDNWIIDFGSRLTEAESSLYEVPFRHVLSNVREGRTTMKREIHRKYWWRHGWVRLALEESILHLSRYIVTPVVAKHRIFAWVHARTFPSNLLDAIARDDDTTFGILHSRFHELWALALGTSLEDRPRYTPTTTFETFPFPEGLTPDVPATSYASDPRAIAIADAAKRLNELRESWLNPPDLVRREPEVLPGYPDRILPKDDEAAMVLKTRTLTNLYNERPAWLDNAHKTLDAAVAAAYGWPAGMGDDEILARLFGLNQARARGSLSEAEKLGSDAT